MSDKDKNIIKLSLNEDPRAKGSNYKPFDVKVGPWYKVTGKVLKKALKKAKSDNAIRELASTTEED